jgi:hypothetical protein
MEIYLGSPANRSNGSPPKASPGTVWLEITGEGRRPPLAGKHLRGCTGAGRCTARRRLRQDPSHGPRRL